MNRTDARKIAEKITNEQILEMFENAKSKITDWHKTAMLSGPSRNFRETKYSIKFILKNYAIFQSIYKSL